MNMRIRSITLCVIAVLLQVGCGSDSGNMGTGPEGVGTAGAGPAAGTGAGTGRACEQITMDPTLANNQCNNPHDKCLEQTNTSMVRAIAGKCAIGALKGPTGEDCGRYVGEPMSPKAVACRSACVKANLTSTLGDTLSDQCLACPDAVVQCGAKYCVGQCLNDTLAAQCTECLCQQRADLLGPGKPGNCLQDVIAQCSGYRPTAEAVGCGMQSGAAGAMATGAAGATTGAAGNTTGGAAGTTSGAAGAVATAGAGGMTTATAGNGTGAAGSAGMSTTAGAGGSSGMGAGGAPVAGSGGTGTMEPATFKRPCLDAANEVVFIGDSYSNYPVAHTNLSTLVSARAKQDGALMSGQYRDLAAAGTTLAAASLLGMIPPQWDDAKRMKPIKAVVMDGGGNDVLIAHRECLADGSEKQPGCMSVVDDSVAAAKKLIQDMKATGVSDVIYFWYPHLPAMAGGSGNSISDYAFPLLEALAKSESTDTFKVQMVDTVPLFEGHPDYFYTDGIHANDTGEGKIADAIYMYMKDNCIAQPESKGCCMP